MTFKIFEHSLVAVYEDVVGPFPNMSLYQAAEYGQLLKDNVINKEWEFANTDTPHFFQKTTFFTNGVSITVSVNKIIIAQNTLLLPPDTAFANLIEITKKFLKNFPSKGNIAVGINFKGLIETTNQNEKTNKLFFSKVTANLPEHPIKSGSVKIKFQEPDSNLVLSLETGELMSVRQGNVSKKTGILVDANNDFEAKERSQEDVATILATQSSKEDLLKDIISRIGV